MGLVLGRKVNQRFALPLGLRCIHGKPMIYKGVAFDDMQRQALMIYSRKRLTIYTASRDYGGKSFFYNKVLLCLREFLHAFHLVEMTIPKKTSS